MKLSNIDDQPLPELAIIQAVSGLAYLVKGSGEPAAPLLNRRLKPSNRL
jgi:hypothetical protein